MYKFLIIEDDAAAAELLRGHVERWLAKSEVGASIDWLQTAFEFVSLKQRYDLIFMDINLPGISGMEAAAILRESDSEALLIFVTDLAKFAVKGYEVDAMDFIVKPVSYESLAPKLDRARRILDARSMATIHVSLRSGMRVFPVSELVYAEVAGHAIVYHLKSGERVEGRGPLKSFIQSTSMPQLVQISSGFVINADHVRTIDGQMMTMSNGDELIISRPKRKEALAALTRYYGGGR